MLLATAVPLNCDITIYIYIFLAMISQYKWTRKKMFHLKIFYGQCRIKPKIRNRRKLKCFWLSVLFKMKYHMKQKMTFLLKFSSLNTEYKCK